MSTKKAGNTVECLSALKSYGIRVARSKFVDSPEDAIAFAERRTAKDPRLVPIILLPDLTPLRSEAEIRGGYYRHVGAQSGTVLAQTSTPPGTSITILGYTGENQDKNLALCSATCRVQSMIPLDTFGAQTLALNFNAHHHRGASEKRHRMLEHLLLKVSKFFEDSGATELDLAVRLHDNSYTVLNAQITAPGGLHVTKRLGKHAHDRAMGEEYRRVDRQ